MCTDQVLHCYNHPLLAVVFNPMHANIQNPKLFEINVDKIVNTDGLKFASKSQTLIEEIPLPEISTEQKVEFAIRVAKTVYKEKKWNEWADKWLNGEDRSEESAYTAAYVANAANANAAAFASAAAWATARAANYAAASAAYAANAANYAAASAAYAANAANAAKVAAYAAANANADANANAAASAAYAANVVDDKNEFNRKMIDIIESIVKMNE